MRRRPLALTRPRGFGLSVVVLALGVACGPGGPEGGESEAAPGELASSSEAPETVADVDDPWLRAGQAHEFSGDLDGMVERGVIRLLTIANRTHYFVDGARERGIVAESAQALEKMLNTKLGQRDAVDVVVVPVRRDQLLPMLTKGLGDVAVGNLTVTPERQEVVDFPAPFVRDVRELVVTAPGAPPVNSVQDLAGRSLWVRRSSSYHSSLTALSRRLQSEGLEPIDVRPADENLEDEGLLEMVQADLYPATVVDSHKLEWVWAKVFPKLVVSDVAVRDKGEVAPAIRKESPQLHALVAEFTGQRRVGTSLGNQMITRYFRKSQWVHNAASTRELRRFEEVVDLFRTYSDRYDFDYLMMIAQGYQESGLDQSVRSPVGAIGVMQVMPTTAAAPPISMADIESLEPNVHAGIKYMRHVVDQYFNDPGIDDVNRHLFAFAAYNAGPTRVSRLRKLAPEYGVDPNLWFRNVERIVASKVGREPVRYVRNIYKYYLAYRRIRDIERERETSRSS